MTHTHQELLQELVVGKDAVVHDRELGIIIRYMRVAVFLGGHTCTHQGLHALARMLPRFLVHLRACAQVCENAHVRNVHVLVVSCTCVCVCVRAHAHAHVRLHMRVRALLSAH